MDRKVDYNDKARSPAKKDQGAKKRMFHKRLFFMSKELQLNTENYIQRSRS